MTQQHTLPTFCSEQINKVILLEAEPGQQRVNYLQAWLDQAQKSGATTWLLFCDKNKDGLWAGLNNLLNDLIPDIQSHAPDLIIKHSYELIHVLPHLRRTVPLRYLALVDTAPENEYVSNHPADRMIRIIHGIIDLLNAWYQRVGHKVAWVIACDHFDHAGIWVQRFFKELMRRCNQQIKLTLLIATNVGSGEIATHEFDPKVLGSFVRLNEFSKESSYLCPDEMTRLAQNLEQQIKHDPIEMEVHLPRLIYYWSLSNQPEKAIEHQIKACSIYTRYGFYEDGLSYGEAAFTQLEHYYPSDSWKLFQLTEKIYLCCIALNLGTKALQVLESTMQKISEPYCLARSCYMIAMLYTRYLPQRDLDKAQAYLQQGLEEIERSDIPESSKLVHITTNRRGLALILFRQGKHYESAELCWSCYEQLNTRFGSNHCLLPQALLLFNVAYAYNALGSYDKAIFYLNASIKIDPNYSEYYNYRGNLYFQIGCLDDAINDYHHAIELSPPFHESWINLGQCYRLKGQMTKAIEAYSKALDLAPNQSLALVGRAQAFEILGQLDAALEDYSTALSVDSYQPLVLANRAILHYDAGRYQEALDDLDRAIALSPETADLYQNRAIAATALGHLEQAVQDLATYLRLNPEASDRSEVESRLLALQGNH